MTSFALAVFLLVATPGPGNLSLAGAGAAFGFRPGIRYALGLGFGANLVALAVATGLAATVFAIPYVRPVLLAASVAYLIFLAARIAFTGTGVAFIAAERDLGVVDGIILMAINPKAYAIATTLFTGFAFLPADVAMEVAIKFALFNIIWIPVHLAWLAAGAGLHRLDLPARTQRRINIAMAASMLAVVGLALLR